MPAASDGDEVVFHTVRFPFAAKVTVRSVEARLGQLGDLRQETTAFWNWLGPPPAKRPAVKGEKAIVWNVTLDDGGVVLGNIELKDGAVVLSVSSAARAERGRAMLSSSLAGLVAAPLTEIQTVEQMRAAAPRDGRPRRRSRPRFRPNWSTIYSTARTPLPTRRARADAGQSHAARRRSQCPRPAEPRNLAEAPGKPVQPSPRPERSDGDLRLHMALAGAEGRAPPQLKQAHGQIAQLRGHWVRRACKLPRWLVTKCACEQSRL